MPNGLLNALAQTMPAKYVRARKQKEPTRMSFLASQKKTKSLGTNSLQTSSIKPSVAAKDKDLPKEMPTTRGSGT